MEAEGSSVSKPRRTRLLAEEAGARVRTVDDQMFTVTSGTWGSSFRLQLFTAPGFRPVAVATQLGFEGASLMNGAERYVEAVWSRHCTDDPEPPIWIAHQFLPSGDDLGFQHIGFSIVDRHKVAGPPQWGPRLTLQEAEELVGVPVGGNRGSGFVPPKRPPEPYERFMPALVIALPRPNLTEGSACMLSGMPWLRRLGRQIVPRQEAGECCWYHGGDWHVVSRMAIRIFVEARRRVPIPTEAQTDAVQQTSIAGITGWTKEALQSLLLDPTQLDRDIGYINGRHRAKAILDAGAHRTLITRLAIADPRQ